MDFLLVTIASVLFPYIFNLSNVSYQANFGINTSFQEANSYRVKIVDSNSDYKIVSTNLINYTGYGIKPDFFLDYSIYKKSFWITPTFGFDPLTNGIQYRTQLKTGGSSSTNAVFYNKGPYFGIKLGLSLFKSNQELHYYGSFGLTPYVLIGVLPISYESEAYYQASQEKRYRLFWGFGSKIDVKGPWSIYLQYKSVTFDTNGSSLNQQLKVNDISYQFGLAYWFRTDEIKSKLNKESNYDNILDIVSDESSKDYKKSNLDFTTQSTQRVRDFNTSQQLKEIQNTNQHLKSDSKLVEKAKSKKVSELFDYEEASDIDF